MLNVSINVYEKLIELLDREKAEYRIVEHEPEGQTEWVSQIRGNHLSQAIKSLVVLVKIGKKESRYYLANVPGDCRVNLNAIKTLCNGTHVMFAPSQRVAELTGCVSGAIPPFSFHEDLFVLAVPSLFENEELVFNAGRLDRSIFINKNSYFEIARPSLMAIAVKENKETI